jgi:hypothetical protein
VDVLLTQLVSSQKFTTLHHVNASAHQFNNAVVVTNGMTLLVLVLTLPLVYVLHSSSTTLKHANANA